MKRPFILIANDDGIKAKGLHELAHAVASFAEVMICAPDTEKSGYSHAISILHDLKPKRADFKGFKAYAINGTPADCVKLGVLALAGKRPALVISGINHGPNNGRFILYSGTVGAAAEAAIMGIPAIAVSLASYSEERDFRTAAIYAAKIAKAVTDGEITPPNHSMLNLNVPDASSVKIRGVKFIDKGRCEYEEKYIKKGNAYRLYIGDRLKKGMKVKPADSHALEQGYITVTPLSFDLNDKRLMKLLKTKKKIFQA